MQVELAMFRTADDGTVQAPGTHLDVSEGDARRMASDGHIKLESTPWAIDKNGHAVSRETAAAAAPVAGGGSSEMPKHSDPKSAWVEFAVSRGVLREEAEASTKDDLINRFPH